MEHIIEILRKASDCYYNSDDFYEMTEEEHILIKNNLGLTVERVVSDEVFDTIYFKVKELLPNHPFFLSVGATVRGDKVKLPTELGSMVECKFGEMSKWLVPNSFVVVSSKLDGNSALLVYDNGTLKSAFSRGDGYEGQDITRHIRKLPSVPLYLSNGFTGFVRGEVIIEKNQIQNFIKDLEKETGKKYANGRNGVAGQLNSKECSYSFSQYAMFVAYKIIDYKDNEINMFQDLTDMGFRTPRFQVLPTTMLIDNTESKLIELCTEAKTNDVYECDGIIVTQDTVLPGYEGFETSTLNPKCSRKYKVANIDDTVITEVEYIQWNVSKDGYFKPRVKVKPVSIQGVTIEWATGHNYNNVISMHICQGAKIRLKRSGDVIPYIVEVLEYPEIQEYSLPETDIYSAVTSEDGTVVDIELFETCPFGPNNSYNDEYYTYYSQMCLNKLIYFCQKMGVDFAGEGNIKQLMDATNNPCMDVKNLLTLPQQVFADVIGVNGIKFSTSLHLAMSKTTPCQFFDATGTFGRGIGELKLQKIYSQYGELPFDENKVMDVEGWAEKMVKQYMAKYIHMVEWTNWLYTYYNHFVFKKEAEPTSDKFKDVRICFTGVRSGELEEVIRMNGGKVLTSVTKECNILVAKDPTSSSTKLNKARAQGVEIISLDQAFERFGHKEEKSSMEGLSNPLIDALK